MANAFSAWFCKPLRQYFLKGSMLPHKHSWKKVPRRLASKKMAALGILMLSYRSQKTKTKTKNLTTKHQHKTKKVMERSRIKSKKAGRRMKSLHGNILFPLCNTMHCVLTTWLLAFPDFPQ